ncbi:hypothetical protein [Pseudomonas mediterranea]|uniref:Uncharacterized protein n=1 Tax=Pseudomonas mediterranea TaxID=183795 RepID=A0AAX2DEF8_9PSED|nr:hypothetical protein [Pseudomonas mediterranea]SDU62169.1 hypothetical protein SAMN05216476_3716 [Pseudomonas mediterranea]
MEKQAKQRWSLNGESGSWDYTALTDLIRDNYGSAEDGTSFGPGLGNGLAVGDKIYRATECKDDPAGFLPDANQITEIMWDNAASSDAGEWVEDYPLLRGEASRDLETALEPLKAWARKFCQPDFFTVKDVAQYTVTAEDVRNVSRQVTP